MKLSISQNSIKILPGKLPIEHENYLVTRNGDRRLIAWSNNVLFDNEGSLEYIIGTGIDITERKQMEAELRKHREHLEELVKERTNELITVNEQLQQEITERKRAEQEMARLERLNLIGKMAAGIAHETTGTTFFVRFRK